MTVIYLTSRKRSIAVVLNDSATAAQLLDAMPFESSVSTWGDEIYFETPVATKAEKGAKADVDIGDVAYWPPGQALCVFFGPTPASTGRQPRAASPVTRVGRVQGDMAAIRQLADGDPIRVTLQPSAEG
jgi:hypothetical protein